MILVRCPHNAVATVTLAFARGAPGAACRRRRPRPRSSAWICLRRGPGNPRCRRAGGRGAPGDRFMCRSYWASWCHALRAEAGQKPGDPEALDCGLRGRYGAAARGRGVRPRLRPLSAGPGVACLSKEGVGKILRLGSQNGQRSRLVTPGSCQWSCRLRSTACARACDRRRAAPVVWGVSTRIQATTFNGRAAERVLSSLVLYNCESSRSIFNQPVFIN